MMCSRGGSHNRDHDQNRHEQRKRWISGLVELTVFERFAGSEKNAKAQNVDEQSPQDTEDRSSRNDVVAFVIVVGQFRAERHMRDRIERHGHAAEHAEHEHPDEKAKFRRDRRVEGQVNADRHRQGRCIHERMSTPPP